MNQQILKFAEQSGSTHKQSLGIYQFYTDELENFVNSIVQECARVAIRTGSLNESDFEGEMIADALKEHFVVE